MRAISSPVLFISDLVCALSVSDLVWPFSGLLWILFRPCVGLEWAHSTLVGPSRGPVIGGPINMG